MRMIAFLAALLFATVASAADLKAPRAATPPAPSWAGVYIGGHVGYGLGRIEGDALPGLEFDTKSVVYGGQAGVNWQSGSWVYGFEIDATWHNKSDSILGGALTAEVDYYGSIRPHVGFTVFPNLLIYGTAGLAMAHTNVTAGPVGSSEVGFGWVAGGGAKVLFGNNLIARVEALYYNFDRSNHFTVLDLETTNTVVRAGLDFKF